MLRGVVRNRELIKADALRIYFYVKKIEAKPLSDFAIIIICLKLFMGNVCGFRDILYYRLNPSHDIFARICFMIFKRTSNLNICVGEIAPGGFASFHAFSTYINAEYIGYGCVFRNNTTIGNKIVNGELKRPTLLNNVNISPNVVIIGDVTIGNNVVIGAGAVVVKSVPDNCVVVGNPAYIISENGIRCHKTL